MLESTYTSGSEWYHSNASVYSEDLVSLSSQEDISLDPSLPHASRFRQASSLRHVSSPRHTSSPCHASSLRHVSSLRHASSLRNNFPITVIINVLSPAPSISSPPSPPWYEEYTPRPLHLPTSRQTVRRDNRLLTSSALPSFSAPNCRSLGPKIRNFIEDMQMRDIACVLASETWEKSSNKKYQKEVERLFEMDGLKMISKPRKFRRGGGCLHHCRYFQDQYHTFGNRLW